MKVKNRFAFHYCGFDIPVHSNRLCTQHSFPERQRPEIQTETKRKRERERINVLE